MNKRDIPLKNYFILGIIVIVTVILTFYLASWYKTSKGYQMQNAVITNVLSAIRVEDIDNYLIDNPNIIIYIASSKDEKIKDFEKDFKKFILKHEIIDEFVYLDTSTITNDNDYQKIEKHFSTTLAKITKKINNKTNLLIVRDGKVLDMMYKNETNIVINQEDVIHFLKMYEVIEND
ncbi:MAG: hypothetical protein GX247_04910 [Mollicutes bacterium]|nr:hypothetical protein [Mollicutes bacterium]